MVLAHVVVLDRVICMYFLTSTERGKSPSLFHVARPSPNLAFFKTHLSSFHLRPNLEEKEDPAPGFLLLGLKSPPGQTGESKVDRQCTDHDKEATQVIGRKFLDQEGVKEDVEAGHDDVEQEETQGWGDNVFFALLLNHVK